MLTTVVIAILLGQAEPKGTKYCKTPDAIYQHAELGGYVSLAISRDGKLIAAATILHHVIVWDTATKKQVATIYHGRYGCLNAVAFSPDGRLLASADTNGVIRLIDTGTWKVQNAIKNNPSGFYRLAFSPDGGVLLSGGTADNRDLILWSMPKGIRQHCIHVTEDKTAIHAIAFAPSGTCFAASWDKQIVLFDRKTCEKLRHFSGHEQPILGLAFSSDSTKLASVSDSTHYHSGAWIEDKTNTKLWEVKTGKEIPLPMKTFQGLQLSISWSPDNTRLAIGDKSGVDLLDFEKPKQVVRFYAQECNGGGDAILFSPDGKYLYAAGRNAVTRWKLDARPEPPPTSGTDLPK